jgi:hypothetical protein
MSLKNTNGNYWRFHGLTHQHLTHVVMSVRDLFPSPVRAVQEVGLLLAAMVTNPKHDTKKRQAYSYRPFEPHPFTAQSAERAIHVTWFNTPTLSCTNSASAYFSKFLRTKRELRRALFWAITQPEVVISYRRFGTTYRSCLQGSRIQKQRA